MGDQSHSLVATFWLITVRSLLVIRRDVSGFLRPEIGNVPSQLLLPPGPGPSPTSLQAEIIALLSASSHSHKKSAVSAEPPFLLPFSRMSDN